MDTESFQLALTENGIPTIMPGETVPARSKVYSAYGPDGEFLTDDPIAAALIMADWEQRKDQQFLASLVYEGKYFEVSTVWLALNHNYGGGPPLVWETMAQSDDWLNFQLRYCTRAAALNGHLAIVTALLRGGMALIESNIDIPGVEVHTTIELEAGDG